MTHADKHATHLRLTQRLRDQADDVPRLTSGLDDFCIEYMAHHEAHHIYQIYQRRSPFGPLPH